MRTHLIQAHARTGLFDLLKKAAAREAGAPEPGVLPSVACGVAAAFTGQLVAFPLEAIARRMQARPTLAGIWAWPQQAPSCVWLA